MNTPTDKQLDFARALWENLNSDASFDNAMAGLKRDGNFTRPVLSDLIERLKAAQPAKPARAATGLDLTEVPAGLYAVPGGDTRLKVRIDRPEHGKWAGWVFVKDGAEYGEGQRYGSQKPGGTYRGKIGEALAAIAADPYAAAAAYGKLVGRCGLCNRPLEDEDSVRIGLGPICRAKF